MNKIPYVAQTADFGSLAVGVGWIVKEAFDPEQTLEQSNYENHLR